MPRFQHLPNLESIVEYDIKTMTTPEQLKQYLVHQAQYIQDISRNLSEMGKVQLWAELFSGISNGYKQLREKLINKHEFDKLDSFEKALLDVFSIESDFLSIFKMTGPPAFEMLGTELVNQNALIYRNELFAKFDHIINMLNKALRNGPLSSSSEALHAFRTNVVSAAAFSLLMRKNTTQILANVKSLNDAVYADMITLIHRNIRPINGKSGWDKFAIKSLFDETVDTFLYADKYRALDTAINDVIRLIGMNYPEDTKYWLTQYKENEQNKKRYEKEYRTDDMEARLVTLELSLQQLDWLAFYRDEFDKSVALSKMPIPVPTSKKQEHNLTTSNWHKLP